VGVCTLEFASGYPQQETCSDTSLEERCKCVCCSEVRSVSVAVEVQDSEWTIILLFQLLIFIEKVRTYTPITIPTVIQYDFASIPSIYLLFPWQFKSPKIWEIETGFRVTQSDPIGRSTASHRMHFKGYVPIGQSRYRESKERFWLFDHAQCAYREWKERSWLDDRNCESQKYTIWLVNWSAYCFYTVKSPISDRRASNLKGTLGTESEYSLQDFLPTLKNFFVVVNLTPVPVE
jgi:hypothetical protein